MDVLLSHQRVAPKDETREAQKRTQEAQEIHFCASGVLFCASYVFLCVPLDHYQKGGCWKSLPGAGLVKLLCMLRRLSICQRLSLFKSAL